MKKSVPISTSTFLALVAIIMLAATVYWKPISNNDTFLYKTVEKPKNTFQKEEGLSNYHLVKLFFTFL